MTRKARVCLAVFVFLAPFAAAQDAQCLFAANQAATVHITYAYATPDGNGVAYGSGFIVSPAGHVMTNAHVVSPQLKDVTVNAATVTVRAGSLINPPVEASILVRDQDSDLASLKLPGLPASQPWDRTLRHRRTQE